MYTVEPFSKQERASTYIMATIETFDEQTQAMTLFLNILSVQKSRKAVEAAIEDADNQQDLEELGDEEASLSDMIHFMSWEFGQIVGSQYLAEMRKMWGIQISMHNVIQERHYKAQKARYEECKRVRKYFTPADREFIERHKALNERHTAAREEAADHRETISEIIEAAFPDAPFDLGWDETWVEAAVA